MKSEIYASFCCTRATLCLIYALLNSTYAYPIHYSVFLRPKGYSMLLNFFIQALSNVLYNKLCYELRVMQGILDKPYVPHQKLINYL